MISVVDLESITEGSCLVWTFIPTLCYKPILTYFHSLVQPSVCLLNTVVSLCVIADISEDDLNQRVEVAYILVIYLY